MADCGLIISAVNKKSLDGNRRKEMKWRKARRREWENETKGQRRRTNRCIHILISFIKIIRLIRLRSLATNEAIAQRRRRSGVHTLLKQASVYIYIYICSDTYTVRRSALGALTGGNGIPLYWNRMSSASADSTPPILLLSPRMCLFLFLRPFIVQQTSPNASETTVRMTWRCDLLILTALQASNPKNCTRKNPIEDLRSGKCRN